MRATIYVGDPNDPRPVSHRFSVRTPAGPGYVTIRGECDPPCLDRHRRALAAAGIFPVDGAA